MASWASSASAATQVVPVLSAAILMKLVDLLIVLITISVIVSLVRGGMIRSRFHSNYGGAMVVIGLVLCLGTYAGNILLMTIPAFSSDAAETGFAQGTMPDGLFWLLTRAAFTITLLGMLVAALHRKRAEADANTADMVAKVAQDSIARSEARFRALFETTSNSIFCFSFDPPLPTALSVDEQVRRSHAAVLTECNEVFARELNAETTADVIGMRLGNLEASKNEAAHYDYVKAFVDSDYRLSNYDLIYRAANGDERAVRSSLTGIVHDGLLLRFWGAESNIQDIRQAKAALRNREQYQELLAEVSTRLLTTRFDDAEQAVKDCLRKICTFIGADRTAIIWYDKSQHSARLLYAWSTIDSNFDIPSSVPEFPWIKGRLKSNVVIRVDDVNNVADDSRSEWAWFRRRGVKSFVLIPLVIDGEFVGASTFSHLQNTRAWSDQDIVDLRVFTELLASVLVRIRSRKALDDALAGLQRATDRLEAENVYLRQEIKRTHGFDEIIGQSDGILRCLHKVEQVADTLTPVLVLGETGTGKELIARAIHEHSDRSAHPLVKVNCAALPGDLIESELFGYEKGAFTGAHRHKRGRFDLADGSTLFLDEIGDIPIELQAKLLRVLQEGEFERLGGTETIKVDVRIVAATNRDLEQSVAAGEFRSDLYYRINTFPIELPPLREREDDVQLLAEHFATVHAKSLGREIRAISANMVEQLRKYHWPGNVRELDGVIQRAMISSSGEILELADPLVGYGTDDAFDQPRILSSTIAELKIVERDHIVSVLEGCGWKISGASGAASKLGIPPSTLRSKMKKLQIERPL